MENTNLLNFTYDQLDTILNTVISSNPNNQEIKQSNELLKKYLKNILSVEGFISQIKTNKNYKIRQLASILLYRKFDKHFEKMDDQTQENVKIILFEIYTNEKNFLVLKAISNIIYKVTRFYLVDNNPKANQILDFILQDPQTYSTDQADRFVTNLNILSEIIVNNCMYIHSRFQQIKTIIQISLKMGTNKIKETSAKCLGNFLKTVEKTDIKFVEDMIPNLLDEIRNFNQDTIMYIYENFCEFSSKSLFIFQNHMERVVQVSLEFLQKNEFDSMTLLIISEFLILIAEYKKDFFKKNSCFYLKSSLEIAFIYASIENTNLQSNEEDYPREDIGERMIEAFSQIYPSKFIFQICMDLIKKLLDSPNDFLRKQGIIIISLISEGCSEKIKENLNDFITLLETKFRNDPSIRVKVACILTLDRITEYCYPQIVDYHEKILPILIDGIYSNELNLVEKSLIAVKYYCKNPDVDIVPYIDRILPRLIELLDSKVSNIQRDTLAALASIIDSTKDELKNTLIPIVETCKNIIVLKTADADCELRAYALECVAHIAYSIKLEKFTPFLTFFSHFAFESINSKVYELQDAGFVYLGFISELLGDSFGNDVDNIMPIALKILKDDSGIENVKHNNDIEENDDSDLDENEEDGNKKNFIK